MICKSTHSVLELLNLVKEDNYQSFKIIFVYSGDLIKESPNKAQNLNMFYIPYYLVPDSE